MRKIWRQSTMKIVHNLEIVYHKSEVKNELAITTGL